MTPDSEHQIGLLISNPIDKRLIVQFLESLGYQGIPLVKPLRNLGYEKQLSLIIADEKNCLKYSKELLQLRTEASPLVLSIIILLSKGSGEIPLMKKGFNEILKLPLTKELFGTKIKNFLMKREDSIAQYRLIFENINIGIYRMTLQHELLNANSVFINLLGYKSFSSLKNKKLDEMGVFCKVNREPFLNFLKKNNQVSGYESIWFNNKGEKITVRENAVLFQDRESNELFYHGTVENITKERQIESALLETEKKFKQLIENSPYGILIEFEEKIVFANKAMLNILGSNDEHHILGQRFLNFVHPDYHSLVRQRSSLVTKKQEIGEMIQEKFLDIHGNFIDVEVITCPYSFAGQNAIQRIVNNISDRVKAKRETVFLTYYDQLTGLPNRAKIKEEIQESIQLSKKSGSYFSLLFIDIDGFNNIILNYDETTVECVLQEIACRIQSCAQHEDTVGSLGADTFIMIVKNVTEIPNEPIFIANQIREIISRPLNVIDNLTFTASIGISVYPLHGNTATALFTNAGLAMHEAKQKGKNNYQFASSSFTTQFPTKMSIEKELRVAIANGDFQLQYQPKLSLPSKIVKGAEALIRWNHPSLGSISPAHFIPIAEETGLIMPLTEVIIQLGCTQAKEWEKNNFSEFTIALNISPRIIGNKQLFSFIDSTIGKLNLEPNLIELEITESTLMQNINEIRTSLKKFADYGIKISIDDFGTGYSSFSYLKNFAFESLKIDRSFISNIHTDENDLKIVEAIISIAHTLDIKVVAEGVENIDQLACLKDAGCDEIQGYYFCKPLPPIDLITFLENYYCELKC